MHWFSIGVSITAAAAIIAIGALYLFAPATIARSFGLPPPGAETSTLWWLRLKGTRDLSSGLVVLAVAAWSDHRTLGIVLLLMALIPFGDMATVLAAKGSVRTALFVHGSTAAVMVLGAVPLIAGNP